MNEIDEFFENFRQVEENQEQIVEQRSKGAVPAFSTLFLSWRRQDEISNPISIWYVKYSYYLKFSILNYLNIK